MKKKFHLNNNQDFNRIIKAKQFYINDLFVIYYQKNNINYSRIGISVSKKNGNAVVRNKIKRQIRMMVAKIFNYRLGNDYVIMIRNKYQELDYATNLHELTKLYKKIDK